MREKIIDNLKDIQATYGVKILYACEAGSRAWGFESVDSDYDVRFIYSRPLDWYLSINVDNKSEVIELKLDLDNIDASGWDLRKALALFKKSNPPLLEWLNSPIAYAQYGPCASKMRELIPTFYSPTAAAYHYLNMAKGNDREYLHGDKVWLKKYLYVIRPLLAVRWIRMQSSVVPVTFQTLVDHVVPEEDVKRAINDLLAAKRAGEELGKGEPIATLDSFIGRELSSYDGLDMSLFLPKSEKSDVETLNTLFRKVIKGEI
jgi:hypothetical protein